MSTTRLPAPDTALADREAAVIRSRTDEEHAMSTQETTDTRNLITRLTAMTREEIHRAAAACRPSHSLPDDIAWWTATAHVERLLRVQHRRRAAAIAARQAASAVQRAAHNTGFVLDDVDVIRVARAASDVAGAITAGPAARADVAYFLGRLGPGPVEGRSLAA